MVKFQSKQRTISLIMLGLVAIVWGAGFVLADDLLAKGFYVAPGLQNALRFGIGTIVLIILLFKDIRFSWKNILYGAVGGTLLFGGFMLQLIGQKYITPAHCGFFTAMYFVLTPFVAWVVNKKAPKIFVWIAVIVAVAGLVILNIGKMPTKEETLGIILTLCSALLFTMQIVWSDSLLKDNKIEGNNFVILQLIVASTLFSLYTLIFESKNYSLLQMKVGDIWWELVIIGVFGSGFAYYAQTYAQKYIAPSQTSLILATESPIGAIISIVVGIDLFRWNIVVGGILVLVAVAIIEFAPQVWERIKLKTTKVEEVRQQRHIDEE